MAIEISHMGEYQEKCYPTPENLFLKIGVMTYAPKMFVTTNSKPKSIIKLGKYCSIAESVNFFPNAEHDINKVSTYPFIGCAEVWTELADMQGHPMTRGDIVVGHDVWIGFGAMIRSGVTIGNGAVIGMGSVVLNDIPPYAIAAGNPAKVIRYRFKPEVIERLNALNWWDWSITNVRKYARLLNSTMDESSLTQLETLASSFLIKNDTEKHEIEKTMNTIQPQLSPTTFDPQVEPWRFLDPGQNNHIGFLNPNYAPRGLIDLLETPPKLALDIGCFIGTTGSYIKQKWSECRVVGIEPVAQAAAQARTKVDAVFEGFFEDMPEGEAGVIPGSVDLAVFADVLEHMRHPWASLRHIREWLSPNGVVLVSLPNIRNLNVLKELSGGTFRYRPAGILDITHIRFFTRYDAIKMFEQTGFRVEKMGINPDGSLAHILQQVPKDRKIKVELGKITLNEVDFVEAQELCALQFYFLLRAK